MSLGLGIGLGIVLTASVPRTFSDVRASATLDIDFQTAANLRNASDVAPSNGDAIKTAVNLVSGSLLMTQATGANRPTWSSTLGGTFVAASSQWLRTTEAAVTSAFSDGNPLTTFIVAKQTGAAAVRIWLAGDAAAARPYRLFFANSATITYEANDNGAGSDQLRSGGVIDTNWHVYEFVDTGSNITIVRDGVQAASSAYTRTTPATVTGVTIGAWKNATLGSPDDGQIARVFAHPTVLSDPDRAIVRSYLGALVGLSL